MVSTIHLCEAEILSREGSLFTPEFKEEAVRLVIGGSRPFVQVARRLGINDGTLGNCLSVP